MSDLISVIVPIYGVEEFLDNCVNSIFNQTYSNIEIILVDDGSLDNCGNMCDEYSKKDSRVKVIHKENGGLSDARNAGIDIASGQFITFIDSDDYYSRDAIEYMYQVLVNNDADISIGTLKKTKALDDCSRNENCKHFLYNNSEAIKEMLYANHYSTAAPAKLYRRELFEGVRYPYRKFSEDLFTTYKLLYKAKRVVYGEQIIYYYYRRTGSITASKFTTKQYDVVEALNIMKSEIPIEKLGLLPAYSSQMVEDIMAMLERKPSSNDIVRLGLWKLVKEYRINVLKDSKAYKRVKGYALLSYFGLKISIFVMNRYYNRKWRK